MPVDELVILISLTECLHIDTNNSSISVTSPRLVVNRLNQNRNIAISMQKRDIKCSYNKERK